MVFEKMCIEGGGGLKAFERFIWDTKLSLSEQKIKILTFIYLRE